MIMKKYGEYLKAERRIRNLSQEKLAKEIGITQQAISLYENNTNEPTIGICEKIADFYGITVDELKGRDYEKTKKAVIYNHSTHNGNNNF